jgi:hypothetical protein
MLITLVLYYWQTECAPLPTKGSELFAITRAHPNTWATHRETILNVFNDVKQELDDYHNYRSKRYEIMMGVGDKGRAIQRLNTLRRKQVRHGEKTDAVPVAEKKEAYERVPTPEERGGRKRVAAGKSG